MAAATTIPIAGLAGRQVRFAPSLPDWFCALFLAARFAQLEAWQSLLGDGDTGWHIRTGEYILDHGVPMRDLFSFSRAGEPWYAWEWLSELIFGQVHRWWGLPGVAAMSALLVCLPAAMLFAWLLRRGVGAWVGLAATLRGKQRRQRPLPRAATLVLFGPGGGRVMAGRRRPPRAYTMAVDPRPDRRTVGESARRLRRVVGNPRTAGGDERQPTGSRSSRRYGLLAALSSLATLINPYGWQLHRHIFEYLKSPWFAEHVQEFQSPQFRSENMLIFGLLLFAGVAVAAKIWRVQPFEAAMIVVWGLLALRSTRYVPLFAVVAAPPIAFYAAERWQHAAARAGARSAWRILWESSEALGKHWRMTPWLAILTGLAILAVFPVTGLANFPQRSFPVAAVDQTSRVLTAPGQRVLTSDQWADYLIYRLYGGVRVFFDGRSDFYGPAIGDDYRTLLQAAPESRAVMARYRFTAALLPRDWALAQILERDPEWTVAYRDAQGVLLVRRGQ